MNEQGSGYRRYPKPMRDSTVEMTEIVLPNDANALGTAFGGTIAGWVDIAGSVAALRHARTQVVTARMGQLDFLSPVRVGHIVILKSRVIAVGRTSMEVQVEIYAEDPLSGTRRHAGTASLTYVAIDRSGNKVEVPGVRPETEEEKRLHAIGLERIRARKSPDS